MVRYKLALQIYMGDGMFLKLSDQKYALPYIIYKKIDVNDETKI